jgi:hypothetical protein
MGQQQLLLIVLGVIIVGIAVVVGINLFNTNAEESTKDIIVSEGTNIGALAQQFYKKPAALGGGGSTFYKGGLNGTTGFVIPASLANSPSAVWTEVTLDSATFVAKGTPKDGDYKTRWSVKLTVTPNDIVSTVAIP